jgi:hypothetical protein
MKLHTTNLQHSVSAWRGLLAEEGLARDEGLVTIAKADENSRVAMWMSGWLASSAVLIQGRLELASEFDA